MNTQKIDSLAKTLWALSMFYVALSVLSIVGPLSGYLGTRTVPGVHTVWPVQPIHGAHGITGVQIVSMGWWTTVLFSITFVLVAALLFCCYRFSRSEKRDPQATVFLWSAAIIAVGLAALHILGPF